jgi:CBS domain containing-hemolysin-like protein
VESVFQLALILFLVLLNGYFVASEFALVTVRKTRIDELAKSGSAMAQLVQKAQANLDSVISTTQLGITTASIALGWVGEPLLAHWFDPLFAAFLPETAAFISAHALAVIVAFTIITYLHVVLGELAPKTVALQKPETVSLIIVAPLLFLTRIFWPAIIFLNGSGALVLRAFGVKAPSGHHVVHSEEEIRMLLAQSAESGIIPEKEAEMVYNVFRFGDTPVKQVMVPRTEVDAFENSLTLADVVAFVESRPHSRFPVYEHSIDLVTGFVHMKDVYRALSHAGPATRLSETDIIREIISVPESKRIDEVLLDMRKRRIHIAVVSDEYGGTAGIVTLEDLLESLVGEIQDEFDQPLQDIVKEADGTFLVDGLTAAEKLQQHFNLPMKGHGYTTAGGLVFGVLGRQPKEGDEVQIGDMLFRIEKLDGHRISTLRLTDVSGKEPAA